MRKINIPKETIEYVIKTYKYKQDACKYLNIDIATLRRLVNDYNLVYPRQNARKGIDAPKSHAYINKEWLIENWVNTGKSMRELAEQEGVNESLIDFRRAKYGLEKRYCYPWNKEKFFDLSDPHIWYLAGLIATDGYVPAGYNAIEISLRGDSETDLLKSIHDYYEMTSPIYVFGEKDTGIRFAGEGVNDFLTTNFGIPQGAKTFTVCCPSSYYNEDCAKAYFRGCLDGDGTIGTDGKSFGILTASSAFIEGLAKLLNTYVGPEYHLRMEGDYPIVSGGSNTGKRALDWAYSLENCFRLERKYERYLLS